MWRATTVGRRLGLQRDCLPIAWAQGDYSGMQVPREPMVPGRYWRPVLARSAEWLRVSKAGAVRRFALEDVVLVSAGTRPRGRCASTSWRAGCWSFELTTSTSGTASAWRSNAGTSDCRWRHQPHSGPRAPRGAARRVGRAASPGGAGAGAGGRQPAGPGRGRGLARYGPRDAPSGPGGGLARAAGRAAGLRRRGGRFPRRPERRWPVCTAILGDPMSGGPAVRHRCRRDASQVANDSGRKGLARSPWS